MSLKKIFGIFSVCTSELYTMKFNFLYHLVRYIRRFEDIAVIDAYFYKKLNFKSIIYTKDSLVGSPHVYRGQSC